MNRVWCLVVACMLVPMMAAADPFTEFRIPDHRVFLWDGTLQASASRNGLNSPSFEGENHSASGFIRTSSFWLHDSDERRTSLLADLFTTGDRWTSESHEISFGDLRSNQRHVAEGASLAASHRLYPWATPVGFEATLAGAVNTSQSWRRDRQAFAPPPPPPVVTRTDVRKQEDWDYLYRATASVALGAGRVRDATSVYDALLLEERLRQRGVLKHPLAPAVRERIAALLYLREPHAAVLDRPGKTLWSELAAILAEDGDLDVNVDPAALIRALEPYTRDSGVDPRGFPAASPILRLRGVFVGLAAQANHFHSTHRTDLSLSSELTSDGAVVSSSDASLFVRQTESQDLVLFGPQGEYHRPLGWSRQVDASSVLLFSSKDPAHRFRLDSMGSAAWIVADRWLATASIQYVRDLVQESPAGAALDSWSIGYDGSIAWYIEDRLRLVVSVSGHQQKAHGEPEFQRRDEIVFALGYRFAGRLDAPGLIEPIRVP